MARVTKAFEFFPHSKQVFIILKEIYIVYKANHFNHPHLTNFSNVANVSQEVSWTKIC